MKARYETGKLTSSLSPVDARLTSHDTPLALIFPHWSSRKGEKMGGGIARVAVAISMFLNLVSLMRLSLGLTG